MDVSLANIGLLLSSVPSQGGETEIEMTKKKKETAAEENTADFEQFKLDNRKRVNQSLSRILWCCVLAGPAIALGILVGVFRQTSYYACLILSLSILAMSLINMLFLKKKPYSYIPGVLALAGMGLLLCYMNASHISIRLTWFIVPLLSLLFCDRRVYIGISVMNYITMSVGIWIESTHYASIRTDFGSPLAAFINIFAGCTIEALIMFAAGFILGKSINEYYRNMTKNYAETLKQQKALQDHLDILDSMAEIYDYVNLIDFTESTEMSLREEHLHKIVIKKGQDHTHMTQGLRSQIVSDMVDDFWRFTDITTVPQRLLNRRSISGEFVSIGTGWFRAQYIRVRGEIDKLPDVVIYTIQNIDSDKRREEHLIRISMTDELTRVFNRRCYEEDIAAMQVQGIDGTMALISADVNGLKPVNDRLGHAAGDELIIGAATCLLASVGTTGKVYRTGGDEFMVIVHDADCHDIVNAIRSASAEWHGALVSSLALSIGYASRADHPDAAVSELERLADEAMYEDKERYYKQQGHARRNR